MAGSVGGWTLEHLLARGAQATSWLAHDAAGMQAVVKVFDQQKLRGIDVPSLQRLATIRHPNVAEILEHGSDASGHVYVATRFVPGTSLAQHLAERGPLTSEHVLQLGVALARALGAIHELGLVLQAVDGSPLSWSLGGRKLLIASSFDWPDDAKLDSSPGTYPIHVQRDGAASDGSWCVIQVE